MMGESLRTTTQAGTCGLFACMVANERERDTAFEHCVHAVS